MAMDVGLVHHVLCLFNVHVPVFTGNHYVSVSARGGMGWDGQAEFTWLADYVQRWGLLRQVWKVGCLSIQDCHSTKVKIMNN